MSDVGGFSLHQPDEFYAGDTSALAKILDDFDSYSPSASKAKGGRRAREKRAIENGTSAPKKRGRPRKDSSIIAMGGVELHPSKKRGRPRKEPAQLAEGEEPPPPKKRGRPRKEPPVEGDEPVVPKPRGRPRKDLVEASEGESSSPKKRSGPRKSDGAAADLTATNESIVTPRKRGRPRKSAMPEHYVEDKIDGTTGPSGDADGDDSGRKQLANSNAPGDEIPKSKKRGRPRKSLPSSLNPSAESLPISIDEVESAPIPNKLDQPHEAIPHHRDAEDRGEPPTPKKRGRPRKSAPMVERASLGQSIGPSGPTASSGVVPLVSVSAPVPALDTDHSLPPEVTMDVDSALEMQANVAPEPPAKKRGRPRKNASARSSPQKVGDSGTKRSRSTNDTTVDEDTSSPAKRRKLAAPRLTLESSVVALAVAQNVPAGSSAPSVPPPTDPGINMDPSPNSALITLTVVQAETGSNHVTTNRTVISSEASGIGPSVSLSSGSR